MMAVQPNAKETLVELELEIWSDSHPDYSSDCVPPRRIWFWRLRQHDLIWDECEYGYLTRSEAVEAGEKELESFELAKET